MGSFRFFTAGAFAVAAWAVAAGCSSDDEQPARGTHVDAGNDAAKDSVTEPQPQIGEPCDVMTQNCAGADTKCTLVFPPTDGGSASLSPRCVTGRGSNGENAACTGTLGAGDDDCLPGLICTQFGLYTNIAKTGTCQRLCMSDADCNANAFCYPAPAPGFCVPLCTLWGSDCPSGFWCEPWGGSPDPTKGLCHTIGTKLPGSRCITEVDCGKDYLCTGLTFTCEPVCDANHPCTTGSCTARGLIGGTACTGSADAGGDGAVTDAPSDAADGAPLDAPSDAAAGG